MNDILYTPSGVRLRRRVSGPGPLNWLLLPGGPGIGSESLHELADTMNVPGSVWMVDLPGDGSNRTPPGAPDDIFSVWPRAVLEAAQALPDVVFVGHSTGGMYLLDTPELAPLLRGLALVDTAPDAKWHPHFVAMTQAFPLPDVEAASAVYEADRCDSNIAAVTVAAAPWNFTAAGVAAGRELLARMPYNSAAVDWSEAHFDDVYEARWWPETFPVLRIAGENDRIVWQGGWKAPRFQTANVIEQTIPGGGHFPWIENPVAVRRAFAEFTAKIAAGREVR
ncbi:MAG: alpha/beta hydrolase [Pseudomonadota bacterium]|uniref:alpha/beta fold hydrolase n=1 Tax=unclassified Phenylobacterium TaxID=2640670 RepID=UPI0006FD571E|nr:MULTISPECIES: alpha/beta hydrolase [unclassified Phenylobacterium]KRB40526.1 alpha/beta hydrolase [Phenylobacterium sp. Root700]MBT9474106.1 alpha/beta hydrolase [Phenylobacterium sp.]